MIPVIVLWFVTGIIVTCCLHGYDGYETPMSQASIGHIVLAPLFVGKFIVKTVFLSWWWIVKHLWDSTAAAAKRLVGKA